jgi:UDP:flavonoid glycosyltransferase YjiC (YdhE family)
VGQDGRVRALFCFTGGTGHFLPTVPIARAVRARGHHVAYSCQPGMVAVVERAGFPAFDSGGRTLTDPHARLPLAPVDRSGEVEVLRTFFAGRTARERAPRIAEVATSWGADVIVRDEVDFGAAVAAERIGLPHASLVVLVAGGMLVPGLVDAALAEVHAELGWQLPPDPGFLDRFLTLAPVMPSFRDPRYPPPPTTVAVRPGVLDEPRDDRAAAGALSWLAARPDLPLVYFTLGTIFHQESGDLFTRVIDALAGLEVNAVVTVGREIDPAELGEMSANVRVERFLPQATLLPRCAAVVSHAGSGTVVAALACGVPLVLLPMGADQPFNADRCTALGVGRVLDPLAASPAEIASAILDVLGTASYAAAAGRLRAEALTLPTSAAAARLVEGLVRRSG